MANVAGLVERVSKVLTVRPLNARYTGEVGDIVVGRVKEVSVPFRCAGSPCGSIINSLCAVCSIHLQVGSKRWRVDVAGRQDAALMLSSVNLSGGVQRRRTYEDQLNMRTYFKEGDLISAEVYSVQQDGALSLHARNLKYGKLENGQFIAVPCALMKRLKQHFVTLPCGVDAIFGLNGYIWLTETLSAGTATAASGGSGAAAAAIGLGSAMASLSVGRDGTLLDAADEAAADAGLGEAIERRKQLAAQRLIGRDGRLRLARVQNAIAVLSASFISISPDTIMDVYTASEHMGLSPAAMLDADCQEALVAPIRERIARTGAA